MTDSFSSNTPAKARRSSRCTGPPGNGPGGGAKVTAIDPKILSAKILDACERRQPELVVPAKARLLFALSQLSPKLGDWLLRKNMSEE